MGDLETRQRWSSRILSATAPARTRFFFGLWYIRLAIHWDHEDNGTGCALIDSASLSARGVFATGNRPTRARTRLCIGDDGRRAGVPLRRIFQIPQHFEPRFGASDAMIDANMGM